MHCTHTLEIFIDNNSRVLILGSFPSVKSREMMFYYSHPSNRFFPVLGRIFNERCDDISSRKELLGKHHIALYDVIEECDIDGSSDSSIRNVIPIDIENILEEYPNIDRIGITGKKASKLFDRYLLDKIPSDIKVFHLSSTSSVNAKMSIDDLVEEYSLLFKNAGE